MQRFLAALLPKLAATLASSPEGPMKKLLAVFALVTAVAPMAAAQRLESAIEQPVARSLNWFAYVAAEDIRASCQPGARSRIRLIYNALWDEQVRTYEVFLQPDGTAGMTTRVLADQGVATSILIGEASDATSPWRTRKAERVLNAAETRELLGLLETSSAFGPPRDGLRLPENDFWWTVASCRNGVWGFQAYHHPSDGFANVKFADRLFGWDDVKVAINRPRKLEPAELRRDPMAHPNRSLGPRWVLVVGKNGMRPR